MPHHPEELSFSCYTTYYLEGNKHGRRQMSIQPDTIGIFKGDMRILLLPVQFWPLGIHRLTD